MRLSGSLNGDQAVRLGDMESPSSPRRSAKCCGNTAGTCPGLQVKCFMPEQVRSGETQTMLGRVPAEFPMPRYPRATGAGMTQAYTRHHRQADAFMKYQQARIGFESGDEEVQQSRCQGPEGDSGADDRQRAFESVWPGAGDRCA